MTTLSQKGVLLKPGFDISTVEVPVPREQPDAQDYSRLLPGSGPLALVIAPFTTLTGAPVAVVFRLQPGEGNPMATRLTASLGSGFGVEIFGPALTFYCEAGKDFSADDWGELDNVIFDHFMSLFEDGTPSREELQQLADDYAAGCFKQYMSDEEE